MSRCVHQRKLLLLAVGTIAFAFSSSAYAEEPPCPHHAQMAMEDDFASPPDNSQPTHVQNETVEPETSTGKPFPTTGKMRPPCHGVEGIPAWMFYWGCVFLLLGTVGISSLRRSAIALPVRRKKGSFDLLSIKSIRTFVNKPWFPIVVQAPSILLFVFVVTAGMMGSTFTNIAPVFTWTIWWGLLVFIVLFFGKAFCMACPWDAIAGLVQRGSVYKQRLPLRTLNLPWPKWASNIYPATVLFIGLTWLELGFGVTRHAQATAVLGLLMVVLVLGSAVVFERRSFCRYGCLIGRISGLYAMFAPVELRPKSTKVCNACKNKDCVQGNDLAMACPTFEAPFELSRNTYCTLCTECVRACPHNNFRFNLRPFGADLKEESEFRKDEAYLAVVLLALTSFHGLTMTPTWYNCTDWVEALFGVGYKSAFSILMLACIVLPAALFGGIAWIGNGMTSSRIGTSKVFSAFAFPLVPIALFYHVAHNVMHFFREAQYLVPRLSDPFGFKTNFFGTAKIVYGPLLSLDVIWYVQIFLILTGHIFGIVLSETIARKLFKTKRDVRLVQIPMLVVMILFSLYSLWLIHQPMEMRTGL